MRAVRCFLAVFSVLLLPSELLLAESWPDWRGPSGNGHAPIGCSPPVEWDAVSGRNILWQVALHGRGHSSPVVVEDQVWLTTATEDGSKQSVVVVALSTGAVLLDRVLFENVAPDPLGNDFNNYAAPSCVAEPGRVYVHFGSYGTACYETEDLSVVWLRRDLLCKHWRGPGSSPILCGDLLVLCFDGADQQYVVGLDKDTGKELWRTRRSTPWNDIGPEGKPIGGGDFRKAFSTPIVFGGQSGSVLLSNASKCWFGYDPKTGEELWRRFHGAGHSGSSRPLHHDGIAFLNTGFGKAQLHAVRVDGARGEVGEDAVLWRKTKNVPTRSSPIVAGDRIYMVDDGGIVSCSDVATGEAVWRERLEGRYSASPVFAAGYLYFTSERGVTTVLRAGGDRFEVMARNHLDPDPPHACGASPAVAGDSLVVRTGRALYRVGETGP